MEPSSTTVFVETEGHNSCGTTGRLGLQRLLADVTAKRGVVVVVYKVDRLTRSLADFIRLVSCSTITAYLSCRPARFMLGRPAPL
jgi:DNA invertase Pin-like site-specific DNA recombinase